MSSASAPAGVRTETRADPSTSPSRKRGAASSTVTAFSCVRSSLRGKEARAHGGSLREWRGERRCHQGDLRHHPRQLIWLKVGGREPLKARLEAGFFGSRGGGSGVLRDARSG